MDPVGEISQLVSALRVSAKIPPVGTNFERFEDGLANIYVFETRAGRTLVYRYDVEIKEIARDKSLTKGGGDDGKKGLLRKICYEIVRTTFESSNGFSSNGQAQFVYDNRKILYTNVQVPPMACEVAPDRMSPFCRKFLNNQSVHFELQPCREESAHELNLNDLSRALQATPYEQADRSLRTFLEMLTSQPFINQGSHTSLGAGRLFEIQEANRITPAITTHRGLAKGVRIVVNGDVKPCPALVADVKTSPFFVADNLEVIAKAMIQEAQQRRRLNPNDRGGMEAFWRDFSALYKGISAYLTYAPWRVIVIDSITTRNCSEISFQVDGQTTTMVDFFRTQKNTNINPNMPAVRQHVDRESVYPLACLHILPFQRFTNDKMSLNEQMAQISKDLLTANAVRPEERYRNIESEMRRIGADGECAKFMRAFNVRLKGGRNDVQIGMMQLPTMEFGNGQKQQRDDKGRFDVRGQMRYIEPSKRLKSWVIAHPRRINEEQYRAFIGNLMRMSHQRGMQLPEPRHEVVDFSQLAEKMDEFDKKMVQFVMYIDNKYIKSHSALKLLERKHKMLTQHVCMEMVSKAGQASVSNVLNKMNMKIFGLNYLPIPNQACNHKFNLASGDVLVIGVDTSRPPPSTAFERYQMVKSGMEGMSSDEPLVVGFCANFLESPVKFVGDYYYQPCRQDMLDPDFLGPKMMWILQQMKENKRKPPKTIFIIRDGVSEGMVPNLIRSSEEHMSEFDAFVGACRRFSSTWQPKFIYCIVDKRHNKRFFIKHPNGGGNGPNGNGNGNGFVALNTKPGSVIDRKFVRVDLHEFFLQAHYPLKGVSKIPQYVFPVNQVGADNNELQAFLHALCNMWQIVNLAPALPTPVLQAKELAKRGRNNFVEFKRNHSQMIPYVQAAAGGNPRFRPMDFARLNSMLSYGGTPGTQGTPGNPGIPLVNTRFNA